MKKPDRKSLLRIGLILLVVLACIGLGWSRFQKKTQMDFAAANTGLTGLSLYTRTLEDLGQTTHYSSVPIQALQGDSLRTLTISRSNASSEVVSHSILEKMGKGSHVLLLYPGVVYAFGDFTEAGYSMTSKQTFASKDDVTYEIAEWTSGDGSVIISASLDPLINLFIADDPAYAYLLFTKTWPYMAGRGIYHDEYYLLWMPDGSSLWMDMPLWLKMLLCQFLVVLAAFVLYRGKRFGKAKKYLEEEEPEEDQYPRAVGELYHRAGHWELALESHWHHFMEQLGRHLPSGKRITPDNWLECWEKEGYAGIHSARRAETLIRRLMEPVGTARPEQTAHEPGRNGLGVRDSRGTARTKSRMRKEIILLLQELEEIMVKRGNRRGA